MIIIPLRFTLNKKNDKILFRKNQGGIFSWENIKNGL